VADRETRSLDDLCKATQVVALSLFDFLTEA